MAKEMMKDVNNSVSKDVAAVKVRSEVSPIREDLATMREDARDAARTLADDAKILARDVQAEGKRYYAKGKEDMQAGLEQARERGKSQYAELASFVQSNPGQSLAVAFVGGMIASMLLGRRGH